MLNKTQAETLFAENAILLGTQDAVPFETLCKLCGAEAAAYAIQAGKCGIDRNAYDCRNAQITYVTKSGFLMAVSYKNALECAERNNS